MRIQTERSHSEIAKALHSRLGQRRGEACRRGSAQQGSCTSCLAAPSSARAAEAPASDTTGDSQRLTRRSRRRCVGRDSQAAAHCSDPLRVFFHRQHEAALWGSPHQTVRRPRPTPNTQILISARCGCGCGNGRAGRRHPPPSRRRVLQPADPLFLSRACQSQFKLLAKKEVLLHFRDPIPHE